MADYKKLIAKLRDCKNYTQAININNYYMQAADAIENLLTANNELERIICENCWDHNMCDDCEIPKWAIAPPGEE